MSEPKLIIAGGENETPDEHQHELTYQATEEDEEKFFLIYHMHIQPSEADALPQDRRQWLIARFVAQKNMEREMMQQAQDRTTSVAEPARWPWRIPSKPKR
jgi:hypothetical protein